MKRECAPNATSSVISYSSASLECLERSDGVDDSATRISGGIFNAGKLTWLARGASLEVVTTKNGSRQAAWRFGWSPKSQRAVCITSVAEFPMEDGVKLVVGLRYLSNRNAGMICLFDPYISRVVKAIEVPFAVTVVHTVRTSGGATASSRHAFSHHLKLFFGVVAVGTEQGHCYLVDMRIDDDVEEFDEWNCSHLEFLAPESTVEDVADFRVEAKSGGAHIGIELGAKAHGLASFSFVTPDNKEMKSFSTGEVFISAVKYVVHTSHLHVGFSFGSFHIWNLETLSLVYSSPIDQYIAPVTHFMYQEPENDPRYCCFVWVARGPLSSEALSEAPATLTLYQLAFEYRAFHPGHGHIYKYLTGCGRRFEHQLTADVHHLADATSVGSRVICCYTLDQEVGLARMEDSIDEEVPSGRDMTLTVCVWEAPSHDPQSNPTCHIGIFDINRWYHFQMPASIRDAMFGSKDPTCPFFAFFSLGDALDAAYPDEILDVFVDLKSVSRFHTGLGPPLDQHLWPASLKFDACCAVETGLVHSKFLGVQRQILSDMSVKGWSCLSDAHDLFNMCWVAGLLPRNFDLSKPQEKSFHHEALLSVALEHGLVNFITSCVDKLGAGNVTHAGCSLKLILDWAWNSVVQVKEQLDQLCVPLFDGEGGTPDDQMLMMLDHQAVQLKRLSVVFQAFLTQSAPVTQQGMRDLESRYSVVVVLSEVILSFIRHGLLPEQQEDMAGSQRKRGCYYPGSSLTQAYEVRRKQLATQSRELGAGGLMIDKLISQLGNQVANQWSSEGGTGAYPPASLHALCSLYLLEKVASINKHSVVYYFLLDMCFLYEDMAREEVADKFSKAFKMPDSQAKLIEGFWLLDHKEFQRAVEALVDPAITSELWPSQNSYILKTLLLQDQEKPALYYLKTVRPTERCPDDVRLHLTVLLANGLVTEAFSYQRQHRDPARNMELLRHFFVGCQETGNMNKLLQLPFNDVEEKSLAKFLLGGNFRGSKELLVMHYLQRGRFVEGIRLNETLKRERINEDDVAAIERDKVRNAIVDRYMKCLPHVQRKLIFGPIRDAGPQLRGRQEVCRPKPLSTVVKQVQGSRPVTHSSVISSVMEKVAEARFQEGGVTADPGPFICTPVTPRTKSLLSDSSRIVFASVKEKEPGHTSPPLGKKSADFLKSPSLLDKRRNLPHFSGADALSLLTTPVVAKRTPGSSISRADSATVSTPQSILKVTRVVRRTPSRTSPAPSPPLARRSFQDQFSAKASEKSRDIVDAKLETPSRRIRFADATPSPTRSKPSSPVKDALGAEDVAMDVEAPGSDLTEESVREPQLSFEEIRAADKVSGPLEFPSTYNGAEEAEDDTEVQITAAVVDLSKDGDLEEVVVRDEEECSSYDSGGGSEGSEDETPVISSETDTGHLDDDVCDQTRGTRLGGVGEEPAETSRSRITLSEDQEPLPAKDDDDGNASVSQETASLSWSWKESSGHALREPTAGQSPATYTQIRQHPEQSLSSVQPIDSLFTKPSKNSTTSNTPVAHHIGKMQEKADADELSFGFPPPAVIGQPNQSEQMTTPVRSAGTPSTSFMFSPPLTRSMAKRRSLDISSQEGRIYRTPSTPHQSPSDSPISFVSPAPERATAPQSRRRSTRKLVRKPAHQMTLRTRKQSGRMTRSAVVPH